MDSLIKDIQLKSSTNYEPPKKLQQKKSSKFSNYLKEEKLSNSVFKFDYSTPKTIDQKISTTEEVYVAPEPPFFDSEANILKDYTFDSIPLSYVYKLARNQESSAQRAMGLNFIAQIASKLFSGEYGSTASELKKELPTMLLIARLGLDSQQHSVSSAALNALNCLLSNDLLILHTTRLFTSIPGTTTIPFIHLQPHDEEFAFESDEEIKRFEQDQILALLESGLFDRLNFLIQSHNLILISQIVDFCLNFTSKASITLQTTDIADQLAARLMEIDPCNPSPDLLPLARCLATIQLLTPNEELSILLQNFLESIFSAALQSKVFDDARVAFVAVELASVLTDNSYIADDFITSLIESKFIKADENHSIFWTRSPTEESSNKAFVMLLSSAAVMLSEASVISPFIAQTYNQSIWSIEGIFFASKVKMSNLLFIDKVLETQTSQFEVALKNMTSIPKITRIHGDLSVTDAVNSVLSIERPTAFLPVTFFINSYLPRLACSLIVAQSTCNIKTDLKSWDGSVFTMNDCISLSFQASLTTASKPDTFTYFSSLSDEATAIAPFRAAAMYLHAKGHSLNELTPLLTIPAIFPFNRPLLSYIKGMDLDNLVAEAVLALNIETFDAWDLALLVQDHLDDELIDQLIYRLEHDHIDESRLCSFLDHFSFAYLTNNVYRTIQKICLSSSSKVRSAYYQFLSLNTMYFDIPRQLESNLSALVKLSETLKARRVNPNVRAYAIESIKHALSNATISDGPYLSIILRNASAPLSTYQSVSDENLRRYLIENK